MRVFLLSHFIHGQTAFIPIGGHPIGLGDRVKIPDHNGPALQCMQCATITRLRIALSSRASRCLLIIGLAGFLSSGAAIAQSHEAPPTGLIAFDIPAEPLDRALDAFGAATGMQIFYENTLTGGRRSTAVRGEFEAQRALRMLLSGSGLTGRVIAPGTISLDNTDAAASAGPPYLAYYGFLQAGIMKTLCSRAETRPGSYHVALQYWIDPRGRIARSKLIGSSGSDERDAAIIDAMRVVELPPPGDMPQPVTMAIEPVRQAGCPSDVTQDGRGP